MGKTTGMTHLKKVDR